MRLAKLHGLGNDYLVLEDDGGQELTPELVRALCDRHCGPGADGVLEPLNSLTADYGLRIHNPDGSEAEKSGNGLRILARWLVLKRQAPATFLVETPGGVVHCKVEEDHVTVDMGRAEFSALPAGVLDGLPAGCVGTVVSMGNPHLVLFLDSPWDDLPWREWGPALETHSAFPNRTNVQFAHWKQPGLEMRIWERGAGETQSSGSSASAAAAAAVRGGLCGPGEVLVQMAGGELQVWVDSAFEVRIRGPVEMVGVFSLNPGWIARRIR